MKRPEDAIRAPTERPPQRDPVNHRAAYRRALASLHRARLLGALVLLAACNLDNPGVSAPVGTLSYPVAVALSREPKPRFLYVANSNFDLAFSAGSVQSYDLEALDRLMAEPAPGVPTGTEQQQNCRALDARGVSLDGGVAGIDGGAIDPLRDAGEVADGGVPDGGVVPAGPVVLPPDYWATSAYGNARGVLCDGRDPVAWRLAGADGRAPDTGAGRPPRDYVGVWPPVRCCFDQGNKLGDIRRSEQRIDSFASGLVVSPNNDRLYVPVSSRTRLLYLDVKSEGGIDCGGIDGTERCRRGAGPKSDDQDPEQSFPGQPASVLVGTLDQLGATGDGSTFVATAHELGGFGLFVDRGDGPVLESAIRGLPDRPASLALHLDPAEPLLYVASAGNINFLTRVGVLSEQAAPGAAPPRKLLYRTSQITLTGFRESRDIRDVAFDPRDPKRIYALVRTPQESLAFLEADPGIAANARLLDAVRVGAGPSKLEYVEIDGRSFLLVSCYDARAIFVIDADRRELVSVVRNLAGPFEMTFDASRNLLFVADFAASVVRVVDLAGVTNKRQPPPRIIATLGLPRFQGGLR